ncbi:MAG: dipeptidase PepV [Firmicutes bacterium]|nr:dipeptidase PepV [Bacillota bacterium]
MDWLKIAKEYQNEYIEKTVKLLQIPTVLDRYDETNLEAPFGKNIRQALDFMLNVGKDDGFKTLDVDHYAGHIEMGEGDEVLGILGHLDVVPTGGFWTNPPFSATIIDGKIYARGSMDDKGPTMAAYIAMRMVKDQKIKLNKKVRLILGTDEESGMRGIIRYLQKQQMPDIGFAPDAEFPLIYGEKGIYSFDLVGVEENELIHSIEAGERYNVVPDQCKAVLKRDVKKEFMSYLENNGIKGSVEGNLYTIFGKNAHAAWPHLGINAIFLMNEFLRSVTKANFLEMIHDYFVFDTAGKKLGIDFFDEEMKDLTLNLAIISYQNNQVKIGSNIRYPKGYPFIENQSVVTAIGLKYGLKYVALHNSPPHYVSPSDPLVQTLYSTYQKYTNDYETPLLTIGGGTYARTLKKAVAFGPNLPGREDLAHQANEYLIIDDMILAAAIYAECIVKLAS